jgi:predicted aldo/keto reductase-like oxidoreductase
MLYRTMPGVAEPLSILGLGCMRLPTLADGAIDEDHAIRMIRTAVDRGVNYVDTAWPYHDGKSEPLVGRALGDGYRDRVNLATKLPSWLVRTREDMDRYLGRQLERLRTDRIDFYLVHAIDRDEWLRLAALGIDDFLDRALADGRIRHAGFSFHGDGGGFADIVDARPWTFCMVQYNYMDTAYQAGTAGVRYAAAKGLGVIAMEPLRGGTLAGDVPAVRSLWGRAPVPRTPAAWALRWVWDHPGITLLLSGTSSLEQLTQNVATADEGVAGSLTAAEHDVIAEVRAEFERRIAVPCTYCGYCQPCPAGVAIPTAFESLNIASMFDAPEFARSRYLFLAGGSFASQCTECGACVDACPQGIPVPERLKEAVAAFGK